MARGLSGLWARVLLHVLDQRVQLRVDRLADLPVGADADGSDDGDDDSVLDHALAVFILDEGFQRRHLVGFPFENLTIGWTYFYFAEPENESVKGSLL